MSGRFKPKPSSRKTSAVPTASTSTAAQPDAEDDFFMRRKDISFVSSKGRLLRQDSNEVNSSNPSKDKTSKATVVLINSSSDNEEYTDDDSPKRKKKAKKRPRATRTASPSKRIRSDEDPDVGSDEDVLDSNYTKKAAQEKAKPKRGPRALTPPEKLPDYILRDSHKLLDMRPQSYNSMHAYGQDLDYQQDQDYAQAIEDSELQSFAESIARTESRSRPLRSPSHHDEESTQRVTITIQMVAHADPNKYLAGSENLKRAMAVWESPMEVDCGLRNSFQSVFDEVCAEKNTIKDDLILTYNGMQVWSSATPESLRIYSSATFKGYKAAIWDQVKARRDRREPSPPPQAAKASLQNQHAAFPAPPAAESTPTAPKDLVSLKVRSKDLDTLSLAVPKETALRTVLKHYLKQVGKLNPGWEEKCTLEFDDEPLDLKMKLSATELEEDDLVEVIISE